MQKRAPISGRLWAPWRQEPVLISVQPLFHSAGISAGIQCLSGKCLFNETLNKTNECHAAETWGWGCHAKIPSEREPGRTWGAVVCALSAGWRRAGGQGLLGCGKPFNQSMESRLKWPSAVSHLVWSQHQVRAGFHVIWVLLQRILNAYLKSGLC